MHNSIWIELIGFDKNAEDFSLDEYLKSTGFTPDFVSLHLTSVNFINCHKGMEEEYPLPDYVCAYNGREKNEQRSRQNWTNYDLRRLVSQFHRRGIKVFASFFDFDSNDDFGKIHPELRCNCDRIILMIKKFADGSLYEDYLCEKIVKVASDYGFDGFQVADGISSPRWSVWNGDFSEELLAEAGIKVPPSEDKAEYIKKHHAQKWLDYYTARWSAFLEKLFSTLKNNGIKIAVNSAWTRDPVEAIYRYGCDYGIFDKYADYVIVEDVASDLAILGEDDCGYKFSYDERKTVHYEFIANLMCIRAHFKNAKITPLFPIWDNLEQWDVINHAPTAMQRATVSNFSHFLLGDGKAKAVSEGPHFCLGDGLTADKWNFIKKCLSTSQIENAERADGATFIYSEKKAKLEAKEYIKYGLWHSAKWLATLLREGAALYNIADINNLSSIDGDIVIANYYLLDDKEKALIDGYENGRVFKVESEKEEGFMPGEFGWWTRPLKFASANNVKEIAEKISENTNAKITYESDECKMCEIITGENTSVFVVENSEYYYSLPVIETKRKIKDIDIITKSQAYPAKFDGQKIKIRIPPRGADIIKVEYES